MTREDVQELLAMTQSIYTNFKPANKIATVNGWHFMLKDIQKEKVLKAFEIFCKTDTSGFAPSPSQILKLSNEIFEKNQSITDLESWSIVRKALRNSIYHSKEEFEELPEICKRVVGNHESLKEWALKDTDEVETVIMSHFLRTYRIVKERMEIERYVPELKPERTIEKKDNAAIETKEETKDVKCDMDSVVDEAIKKLLKK